MFKSRKKAEYNRKIEILEKILDRTKRMYDEEVKNIRNSILNNIRKSIRYFNTGECIPDILKLYRENSQLVEYKSLESEMVKVFEISQYISDVYHSLYKEIDGYGSITKGFFFISCKTDYDKHFIKNSDPREITPFDIVKQILLGDLYNKLNKELDKIDLLAQVYREAEEEITDKIAYLKIKVA